MGESCCVAEQRCLCVSFILSRVHPSPKGDCLTHDEDVVVAISGSEHRNSHYIPSASIHRDKLSYECNYPATLWNCNHARHLQILRAQLEKVADLNVVRHRHRMGYRYVWRGYSRHLRVSRTRPSVEASNVWRDQHVSLKLRDG